MRPMMLVATAILVSMNAGTGAAGDDGPPIDPERIHRYPLQHVTVEDFHAEGWILAIGGGGEGIIGRLKGPQVVAIDIVERELADAPPGPLKIVMDARDLGFLEGTFNTAASFFTLMYINGQDHSQVLTEVFRVLAPGGRLLIWDAVFGPPPAGKDVGVVPLEISLPSGTVQTGYGVAWPAAVHDLDYYRAQATSAGFEVVATHTAENWFYLEDSPNLKGDDPRAALGRIDPSPSGTHNATR